MALDVGVFSNLQPQKPVDLLTPYLTMQQLKTMQLQQQGMQLQQQDVAEQIQQRRIANAKAIQAAKVYQDAAQNGTDLDSPQFISQLAGIDPQLALAHQEHRARVKELGAQTAQAEAVTKKTQQEIDLGPTAEIAPGGTLFNRLGGKPVFTAPLTALQNAEARKANAEATVKELEAGTYPQTVDDFQSKLDALAPPTDKTFADTNKRFGGMAKAGPYTPAIGAGLLKQAASEAEKIAVAKNTVPFKVEVQQAGAAQATGDALDLMAEQALNGNFTSRNPVLLSKVYARAAEKAKTLGMTNQQVVMAQNAAKANKEALNRLTTQQSQVEAFSQTAEKNMRVLESAIQNVSDLGAPFLNTPLRNIQEKFAGNPKVSAFTAAITPVQAEVAKILNSAGATTGMLTDTARGEMQAAISPGATPAQLKAALDIFRQDIANRKSTYEAMIKDLTEQSAVGGSNTPASNSFIKPGGALEQLLKQ
jgi:hypothetical protein